MGQINRGTVLGEMIFMLASLPNVKTVVEIGPCDGDGTTHCIINGLKSSKEDYSFLSIEIDSMSYNKTLSANPDRDSRFQILHGKVLTLEQLESYYKDYTFSTEEEKEMNLSREYHKSCQTIFDKIPNKIDLLVMDGGEMDSEIEFTLLSDRATYIILDDSFRNSRKFKNIRQQILQNSNKYKIIMDITDEDINRHGYMVIKNLG